MALSPVRARASSSVGSSETIAFTRSNSPALMASMNAAWLAVGSAMIRSYRAFLTAIVVLSAVAAHAQTPSAPSKDRPPLGSALTVGPLAMLPSSEDLIALAGAEIPEIIADRVDTGGLSTGDPARIGARGSSWTQTMIRVGQADITNPLTGGVPLLVPRVDEWERADFMTGMMPIDVNAPGLALVLTPRRPADMWQGSVALTGALPFLNAGSASASPPSIARLDAWSDANLVVSGPVSDRTGLFLTASGTRSTRFERADPLKLDADLASAFAHLRFTPSSADAVSGVGWFQRARYPFANRIAFAQPSAGDSNIAVHTQVTWTHTGPSWTAATFGSITAGDHRNDLVPSSSLVVERLTDGPIPDLVNDGSNTSRTWSIGTRVDAAPVESTGGRHQFVGGIEASGSAADARAAFSGRIGEMLNGVPTRVWDFTASTTPSSWSETTLSFFGSDRIDVSPRITVDGGIRFETIHANNTGGAQVVSWHDFMPKLGTRIALTDRFSTAGFAYYGRYGHRLPLSDLAWGDPTAPFGRVSLWNTTTPNHVPLASEVGTLIARVGPGTGGDPSFSAIDPALARPHMDEIVAGFEGKPNRRSTVRLYAIARRERELIGAADVGVPESTYQQLLIPDHGVDQFGSTDQLLPVFNRAPSTFGADRYLLTNPPDDESTFVGADLTFETQTEHLYLLMAATAGRSEGLAANVGFGPTENDNGLVGDVFIDPNARTFAQGRLFTERG